MKWHNFVSAIVLGAVAMGSTGFAIDLFGCSTAKGAEKTANVAHDKDKGCAECCPQWCATKYRVKCFPCVKLPNSCGCCDKYCPKAAPCFSFHLPCGVRDEYCPKAFPCLGPWQPSLCNGRCPLPAECISNGANHVEVSRLRALDNASPPRTTVIQSSASRP